MPHSDADPHAEACPDFAHLASWQLTAKRLIDVVLAGASLVAALPLMILIAAGIKIVDRGPVFFVQERVGRGGRPFKIVKFRTMRVGTHLEIWSDDEQRHRYIANNFKLPADDPRITSIGAILRKTSLDEIPQLANVLLGHMSLVGVRPLLREELARRPVRDQVCYTALRPGMTGLWQVEGRSDAVGATRELLDRRYIEYWTLRGDLTLLLRTPPAVLRVKRAR